MRILAVDWGERRLGLAICDPMGVLATGLPTLTVKGRNEALERIAATAVDREAERIVVGLPLTLAGERGAAAQAAERFAADLAARSGLPVETYDERLTSALSVRRLREAGVKTGRDKGLVDQGAAIELLRSYLQRQASRSEAGE